MRGQPDEQRPRLRPSKACPRQPGRRTHRIEPEPRHRERLRGHAQHRPEHRRREAIPTPGQRPHQFSITLPVRAEPGGRVAERPMQRRGASVIERVRERDVRMDPAQPVVLERKLSKERRARAERMDRRAHVVVEAGECELRGAAAPTYVLMRLDERDRHALPREHDGSREAVRPGPNDDGTLRHQRPCLLSARPRNGFEIQRNGAPAT